MRTARFPRIALAAAALLAARGLAADGGAPPQGDWPKTIPLGQRKIVLDAPHAESFEGTALKAKGDVGLVRPGAAEPVWGTIWYEADVVVDRAARTVTLASVRVPKLAIEGVPKPQQERLAGRLGMVLTRRRFRLGLDDVLAEARTARWRRDDEAPKLGTDPPAVLFESEPSILVTFDGEPRFHAVEGSSFERAMNTAFLVLHDPSGNAYWLNGGAAWYRATDLAGTWSRSDDPPAEAVRLARADRKDAGIDEKQVASAGAGAPAPKVIVATVPTEMIVTDGAPRWTTEVDGALESMGNTESNVFRTPDGRVFILLSGRWYSGEGLGGPWTFVLPTKLPAAFHRIHETSAKAAVLAFVPGTGPAREAMEDARTPRTAAVRRRDAHVTVTYDGEPRFEAIAGTRVEYALNTPQQVLRIRGRYYVCDQGVWFTGGSPTGPWLVADAIPEEEIQAIPPESPVYNTRFVYVYDATPDVVYTAYTPAYVGSYPFYGTVVFGTGWAYRPWWGAAYYPRPWTWGFGAFYRPWAGWGYGFGWGPAWAGFRFGFGLGWGAAWCGPAGFYRPAFAGAVFARNVSITRNVSVTRNVYNTGATRSGVASTAAASRGASPGAGERPHTVANRHGTQSTGRGAGASGTRTATRSASGHARGAGKPRAAAHGHAGHGAGGGHRRG